MGKVTIIGTHGNAVEYDPATEYYNGSCIIKREPEDIDDEVNAIRQTNSPDEPDLDVIVEVVGDDADAPIVESPDESDDSNNIINAGECSDSGNAEKLCSLFKKEIRFCRQLNHWLVWKGFRWETSTNESMTKYAQMVANTIFRKAARDERLEVKKALSAHALRSLSEPRIKAMISLARTNEIIAVYASDLDRDLNILNIGNGTIRLATGLCRPPRKADYLTKLALGNYDERALFPNFFEFIKKTFNGNLELMAFVKRAIGYSLSGDTSEQCMFICFGSGSNGKSTLLNVIYKVLGDYAIQIAPETLMENKHKDGRGPSPDLARLKGYRFILTSEINRGQKLDESLVKQMTGGDNIVARNLYGNISEFKLIGKIWSSVNHKPVISGSDYGIWRRIHLIPFNVTIPPEECDKYLTERLLKEAPGILNWALEGYREWKKEGLNVPDIVKEATAEYKTEMDMVGQWINERCEQNPGYLSMASDLYSDFRLWLEPNQRGVITQTMFGRKLVEHGFQKRRTPKIQYSGIKILG